MMGTVVIISIVHWHFTWQIQQSIAQGLAQRGYRVLFIEPLPKRWPRISEFNRVWGRLTGKSEAAGICRQPLVQGVELVSPRLLPDTGFIPQRINRRLFVPNIAAGLKRLIDRPLIVINYLPTSASITLMEELRPDAAFYHCVNDWPNDPYASTQLKEAELAARVDMVWADSILNTERTSLMSKNVISMAGGVNIEIFSRARQTPSTPPDTPLCAYFGSLRDSIDIDLLRAISKRFPLRLIGPARSVLEGFSDETEIIGAVPQVDLPDLLRDVDVLLLPYRKMAFNDSVMPAKLFECLATGKPTIVTGLASLSEYSHLLYFCDGQEEVLDRIANSVHESPTLRGERIACAEQNSYPKLITDIEGYFQQVLPQRMKIAA